MEHQEGHIAEHTAEEENLGDKFANNVGFAIEILVVAEGHKDSKHHVDDAEDDGHLHLERVEEDDLV